MLEQVDGRTCDPMEGPYWSSLFQKDVNIIPGCLASMQLLWRGTDIQGSTKQHQLQGLSVLYSRILVS